MPKVIDHEKYRGELLGRCFPLLSSTGFASITMRQIAKELGISTGSLYHYFPNKQSILEQMFVSMSRQNVAEAIALLSDDMSLEEKLAAIQNFWRDSLPQYQGLLLLAVDWHRNSSGDSASLVLNDFLKFYQTQLTEHLDLSAESSGAIVIFILGIVCQTLLAPGSFDFDTQTEFLKNTIVSYMGDNKETPR